MNTRALLLVALLAPLGRGQSTWYVAQGGIPPGSGTPGDPYASVQYAIAQPTTVDGDTVLVSAGTYEEAIDFLGKAVSVKSVDGPATTILRGDPAADPPHSVVTFNGSESRASVLEGFTVREGNGTKLGSQTFGGGVFVGEHAWPTLRDLVIEANTADQGGGVRARHSYPLLDGCTLRANQARFGGGAALLDDLYFSSEGSLVARDSRFLENTVHEGSGGAVFIRSGSLLFQFEDCEFDGNSVPLPEVGGALYTVGAYGQLSRCVFSHNSAAQGAGAYLDTSFGVEFDACTFFQNVIEPGSPAHSFGGAGIFALDSLTLVSDCLFQENVAVAGGLSNMWGAAIHSAGEGPLEIYRTVFADNRTDKWGGAIYFQSTFAWSCLVSSCTFRGNSAPSGGALYTCGVLKLSNSILWQDSGGEIAASCGNATVSWSDVQGGYSGTGNIDADPRFWDVAAGDLYLEPHSPCIDSGDPTKTDPDGTRLDMGAFAFDRTHCALPAAYCAGKPTSVGCIPAVGYAGLPSRSGPDDFRITATDVVNHQPGLMFWGRAPAETPFQGGTLCVAPPIVRTSVQESGGSLLPTHDCTGSFSFAFTHALMASAGLAVGDTLYAQYWFRDPAQPDGTGIGLSDALRFSVCP